MLMQKLYLHTDEVDVHIIHYDSFGMCSVQFVNH